MTKRQFAKYYGIYQRSIAAIARKLGGTDDALVADLEQEGALTLWLLNIRSITSNEDAYVRQCLKFRMIDHLRRYNPAAYDSLDALLEAGAQVDCDETGQLRLLRARPETSQRAVRRYGGDEDCGEDD
jgi:DNA-directed RNA polymerase specialized sigma24 family protein